jgi:hypothetical protein
VRAAFDERAAAPEAVRADAPPTVESGASAVIRKRLHDLWT